MVNAFSPRNIAPVAFLFEAALGFVAIGLGYWLDIALWETVSLRPESLPNQAMAIGWGALATLPLVVGLVLMRKIHRGPLGDLNRLVDDQFAPLFVDTRLWEFALIALAAGWGEEMLFRGWLQVLLTRNASGTVGLGVGLGLSAAVFGFCHWISLTYALLAMAAGVYLGGLLLASDQLLVPITTHALYDFVALVFITRTVRRPVSGDQPEDPAPTPDRQTPT